MRVGIVGLLQESNTFLAEPTTVDHFRQDLLLTGEAVRERMIDAHHEIGGFFAGLKEAEIEAVPIFLARALPFGAMTDDTYAYLRNTMLRQFVSAGRLDGVLVACHGANVARSTLDLDGDWLRSIRRHVGTAVPVVATLDLHGNLSAAMVDATNAILAYRTNPHLDQRACGLQAATLIARTLAGEIHPTQAAAFPPLVINIERQLTAEPPCLDHFQAADRMLAELGVLSNSILLGFPYADVPEMGCSVIVVTDGDIAAARARAGTMARSLWQDRQRFVGRLIEIEAALDRAAALDGPVCLLDMGDNVGGGSPGDGTYLARALHGCRVGPSLVCLFDPGSAAEAAAAGRGATLRMQLGGKTDSLHGAPLEADFTVQGLYEGTFIESAPRHGGFTTFDQGPTAVVSADSGLTVLLASRRMVPFSLAQLTSCEIDPARFQVLVAKGVHAPVAAYQAVCRHFLRVNTPGVTAADLNRLDYRNRRRPLFPFEQDFDWEP